MNALNKDAKQDLIVNRIQFIMFNAKNAKNKTSKYAQSKSHGIQCIEYDA